MTDLGPLADEILDQSNGEYQWRRQESPSIHTQIRYRETRKVSNANLTTAHSKRLEITEGTLR